MQPAPLPVERPTAAARAESGELAPWCDSRILLRCIRATRLEQLAKAEIPAFVLDNDHRKRDERYPGQL